MALLLRLGIKIKSSTTFILNYHFSTANSDDKDNLFPYFNSKDLKDRQSSSPFNPRPDEIADEIHRRLRETHRWDSLQLHDHSHVRFARQLHEQWVEDMFMIYIDMRKRKEVDSLSPAVVRISSNTKKHDEKFREEMIKIEEKVREMWMEYEKQSREKLMTIDEKKLRKYEDEFRRINDEMFREKLMAFDKMLCEKITDWLVKLYKPKG